MPRQGTETAAESESYRTVRYLVERLPAMIAPAWLRADRDRRRPGIPLPGCGASRYRARLPVPFITPKLSSLWIGPVTPVDAGVARPLIESLASETVVTDPEPARRFTVEPMGCREALRRARAEEEAA